MSNAEAREVVFRLSSEISEESKKSVKDFGDLISGIQSQIDSLAGSSIATVHGAVSAIAAQSQAAKSSIKEVIDGSVAIVSVLDSAVQHSMTSLQKVKAESKSVVASFATDSASITSTAIQSADKITRDVEKKLLESSERRKAVVHDRVRDELELELKSLEIQVDAAKAAAEQIEAARNASRGNVASPSVQNTSGSQAFTDIEKQAETAIESIAKTTIQIGGEVEASLIQQLAEATSKRDALLRERAEREQRIVDEMEHKRARGIQLAEEMADRILQAQSAMESGNDLSEAFMRETEVITQEAMELAQEVAKWDEERTKKEEAESKKREAIAEREAENKVRQLEKQIEREREVNLRRQQEEAEAEKEREIKQRAANERSFESLTRKARESGQAVVTSFLEMNEAAMRFARGLTALGLVGEDDLGKVRDTLLKMQSIMDLTNGGLRTLVQMDTMYRRIRESINAATQARKLFEASGGTLGGGSGRSVFMGGGVRGLIQAGLEGGVGGVVQRTGSAVAGGVLGYVGAGMINSVGGSIAKGGGAVTVGGATVGAGAGAIFALTSAILSLREAIKHGFGGGATKGSYVETVGTSNWNPFAYGIKQLTYSTQRKEDEKRIAEMAAEGQKIKEVQQNITDLTSRRIALESTVADSLMEQKLTLLESLTPTNRILEINNQLISTQAKIQQMKSSYAEDDVAGQESIVRTERELMALLRVRQATEREIYESKKNASETDLEASKSLLDNAIKLADEEERRYKSAMQRFGLMSEEDRTEVVDIKRRLDRGEALTGDELRKVQGYTVETDARVAKVAEDIARGSGFDDIFGGENQKELERLRSVENALEIQVKQKMDVVVNIEADYNHIAKVTAEQIESLNAQHRAKIEATIQELVEKINNLETGLKNRR